MSDELRKAIDEFKTKNGNDNFSNKDLLIYIIQRLDDLPCAKHMTTIENTATTMKNFKWFAGILITINFSLIAGILFLVIN